MKICTICKIEKPLSDFHKRKSAKDGYQSECKSCTAERNHKNYSENKEKRQSNQKEYRSLHKEETSTRNTIYREEHADELKEYKIIYDAENKDKARVRDAAYNLRNKDKRNAQGRLYRIENPHIRRINHQNRRARKKEAGGSLSQDLYPRLFKLQRGHCAICKEKLSHLRKNNHLDHIMPITPKGDAPIGSNTDENIQLLCSTCNSKKSNRDPIEYMQSLGFLI